MMQTLIAWTHTLPNELMILLLAALPVVELRAAIPVAVGVLHMSALKAYVISVLGNWIPLVLLFLLLPAFIEFIANATPRLHQVFEQYFFRLSKKHEDALNRYGSLFLFVFVAIPHPGGGVWTASLLSVLFRVNPKYAIPAIALGVMVSGLIMLSLTEASIKFF